MSGMSWSKFWWKDWQNDLALKSCSLAARGLWMEMLAIMHASEIEGHLLVAGRTISKKTLAGLVFAQEKEVGKLIDELRENNVFSETSDGVIYSRRMVKDAISRDQAREFGKMGGNPHLKAVPSTVNGSGNPPDKAGHNKGVNPPHKLQEAKRLRSKSTEVEGSLSLTTRDARESEFAAFWSVYPRRVGKDRARAAFDAACKRGADPGEIVLAARQQRWNPNPRYIPHPATWLSAGSWQDDPDAASPPEPDNSNHRLSVCNAMMGYRQ